MVTAAFVLCLAVCQGLVLAQETQTLELNMTVPGVTICTGCRCNENDLSRHIQCESMQVSQTPDDNSEGNVTDGNFVMEGESFDGFPLIDMPISEIPSLISNNNNGFTLSNSGSDENKLTAGDKLSVTEKVSVTEMENEDTTEKAKIVTLPEVMDLEVGGNISTSTAQQDPLELLDMQAKHLLIYRVGIGIHKVWPVVLFFSGMVGNSLAVYVMSLPSNISISCCVYMIGVAISDTIMCFFAFLYWAMSLIIKAENATSVITCKLCSWWYQSIATTGTTLIIFMTIDRYIAVTNPLKAKMWCTTKRAKVVVVLSFLFGLAYGFPFYLSSKIVSKSCVSYTTTDFPFFQYWAYVNIFLNSVFCFFLLLFLNVGIIRGLRASRKLVSSARNLSGIKPGKENNGCFQDKASLRERQLTRLLLIISFTFLAFTLPLYFRYIYYMNINPYVSPHSLANYVFAVHFTNKLFYTNNAINFYLYVIGGSKFKEDLKKLFCRKSRENITSQNSAGSKSL